MASDAKCNTAVIRLGKRELGVFFCHKLTAGLGIFNFIFTQMKANVSTKLRSPVAGGVPHESSASCSVTQTTVST